MSTLKPAEVVTGVVLVRVSDYSKRLSLFPVLHDGPPHVSLTTSQKWEFHYTALISPACGEEQVQSV